MSETLEKPIKAAPGKTLTPEQIAWNVRVFNKLGWQSKKPAQEKMRAEMKASCLAVDKTVLQPGVGPNCADRISQEKLKPGKEFKAFQVALTYFEKAAPDARAGLADQLRTTANAYITHWDKHSKREKNHPETKRKKEICDQALADLRKIDMAVDLRRLGDPPWDSEKSMKAASLKATLDFESMPDAKAEVVGGVHAYPAFWVNSAKPPAGQNAPPPKAEKSFLFKPTAVSSAVPGFPAGGDTAREAMAGRMGDMLAGMTGQNFGVPETHVVSVGQGKLPAGALDPQTVAGAGDPTAPLTGSLQQFAKSSGGAREQPMAEVRKVPAKACQKIMILDMLTLNMDRHGDNVMVQAQPNGEQDLVPIDHGLTFPPHEARADLHKKVGSTFNAMLTMPGSHEPFTQEMLKAIDDIDPDSMQAGMRRELTVIEKQHPGTKGKVDREGIDAAARSAKFLKMGAAMKPPPSPAAIQLALGQYGEELLDPALNDSAFNARATEVLADMAGQQGAIKELFMLPPEQIGAMRSRLLDNGWLDGFKIEGWCNKNAKLAMDLYKGDVKEPAKLRATIASLGQDVVDDKLKTMSLRELFNNRKRFVVTPPSTTVTDKVRSDANALRQAFPDHWFDANSDDSWFDSADLWKRMEALGGLAALPAAFKTVKSSRAEMQIARKTPSEALTILSAAAAMPLAEQSVGQMTDLDARSVKLGIEQLDKMVPDVPAGHPVLAKVTDFKKERIDGSPKQLKDLADLQFAAIDAIRADVGKRLADVGQRIEALIENEDDEDAAGRLRNKLEGLGNARTTVMAGVVTGAQQNATRWETQYP